MWVVAEEERLWERSVRWGPTEAPTGGLDGTTQRRSGSGWGCGKSSGRSLDTVELFDTVYLGIATRCQERQWRQRRLYWYLSRSPRYGWLDD